MRTHLIAATLAALVAGCAGSPPSDSQRPAADGTQESNSRYGHAAVASVATPFYVALKVPVCLASIAIAAPLAGISGLAEGRMGRSVIDRLGEGVGANCGPPYVLPSPTDQ